MSEPDIGGYVPTFTPAVRTKVYIGCVIADVVTLIGVSIPAILGALDPVEAVAIGGVLSTANGLVAKAMAVAYRPTRPEVGTT